MCGGCGKLLYLTGDGRFRRSLLLVLPTVLGVAIFGFSALRNIEGLNVYREARGGYEPNFVGFLLILAAINIAVSLLERFEIVGIASVQGSDMEQVPLENRILVLETRKTDDHRFKGTLGNVFRIPNGAVLIVENYIGEVPPRARVRIGAFSATLVSVDILRKADQGAPIIALFIQEDAADILATMKGQEIRVEHP